MSIALDYLNKLCAAWTAGQTVRYHQHVANMRRPQTVAEHTFNGAMLLFVLYDGAPPAGLMNAWLLHDAGERWVGDIPYPTKAKLRDSVDFDAMEWVAMLKFTGLRNTHYEQLSLQERNVLKVVDLLEGLLFSSHEANACRSMKDVRDGYSNGLRAMIANSEPDTLGELPDHIAAKLTYILMNEHKLEL
jgi:5'-deoxynucleotidase YfbR-like HD superfamily hydrolase